MRDDRLKSTWQVDLAPFLLARYPVTQEKYEAVTHKQPSSFQGSLYPVESVSWFDAIDFCNKLSLMEGLLPYYDVTPELQVTIVQPSGNGYRLPFDAEWQYACQAGTSGAWYGKLAEVAWYKDNSGGHPQEVGKKQPNGWGLFDMLGNVWEWCQDEYDTTVYDTYRVFRGGGWSDPERGCLATNRRRGHPSFKIDDLGFRVARSL